MTILALIVAAIAIQIVLAALVIKTLWIQGDTAARRADEAQPSRAATLAPQRGRWGRPPRVARAK
jgi:hypothetical protein